MSTLPVEGGALLGIVKVLTPSLSLVFGGPLVMKAFSRVFISAMVFDCSMTMLVNTFTWFSIACIEEERTWMPVSLPCSKSSQASHLYIVG